MKSAQKLAKRMIFSWVLSSFLMVSYVQLANPTALASLANAYANVREPLFGCVATTYGLNLLPGAHTALTNIIAKNFEFAPKAVERIIEVGSLSSLFIYYGPRGAITHLVQATLPSAVASSIPAVDLSASAIASSPSAGVVCGAPSTSEVLAQHNCMNAIKDGIKVSSVIGANIIVHTPSIQKKLITPVTGTINDVYKSEFVQRWLPNTTQDNESTNTSPSDLVSKEFVGRIFMLGLASGFSYVARAAVEYYGIDIRLLTAAGVFKPHIP